MSYFGVKVKQIHQNVCSIINHKYAKYKKLSLTVIEISLERTYFDVSPLGEIKF